MFTPNLKIWIFLPIIFTIITSCVNSGDSAKPKRETPEEFEFFQDCSSYSACFRVFAKSDESLYDYKPYALMIGWMDTARCYFSPITAYRLKHKSGKYVSVENTDDRLLSYWEFRDFVHYSLTSYKDTVVNLDIDLRPFKEKGRINFAGTYYPFLFLDVTFDGRPELLVRKNSSSVDSYYNVYELTDLGPRKLNQEPYIAFKTTVSSWMLGSGTVIDYDKKQIVQTKLKEGSCACHGTFVYVTYTYDEKTEGLTRTIEMKDYEVGEH